jgi:hypothetical protein
MASDAADPTVPLDIPKARRRYIPHRTRLVTRSNERQLELQWTEVNNYQAEAAEPEKEPPATEQTEVAVEARPEPSACEIAKRAYPLAYDPEGPAGSALRLLNEVQQLTQSMTDAYGEGDLATVGSRLTVAAGVLGKAYPHTAFNPALGSTVSFLRRATLLASADQCGFEELMGLAKAARHIAENPLISLDDAAEVVMQLEAQGWTGADPDVAKFVSALFGEEEEVSTSAPTQEVEGSAE